MISFIRKYVTTWPVLLLLGLVLVAFVITGVGDPFGGGAASTGELAKAGKTAIGEQAVLQRFERVIAQARETSPGLTQAEAARQGGVEQVVDQLAGVAALAEFGTRHGVVVSERLVDGEIASVDAFRVGGKFDDATFRRLLAQQRLSERELREGLRSDLMRKQLLVPVATGAQVPREVAAPYARLLLDMHEGGGSSVPPPAVPAPSAAQVAAFYAANKARFVSPERRGFRYALIDRAGFAAAATLSDAEVEADYVKNREAYGGVEQRRLSQLVLPDAAKAKAFVAAVNGGESFAAAAARATGAAASDVALGLVTRDKFATATSAALATQVFAARPGSVVGPVQTDFGWNVVRVDEVVAAQGKSVAALKPVIVAKLRDAKAEAALADLIAKVEDGLAEGASFADIVKTRGLAAVTVAPVAKDGAGAPPAALPLVTKAFDAEPADGAAVVELDAGRFALLELDQVIAPAPPPLAQISAQVTAALTLEQRSKAAKAIADAVIADVGKGTSFAAALAKRKLAPPRPIRGRRIDIIQQQKVPPAIEVFLSMPAATTRALPATDGTVLLIRVDRIVPGDLAAAPPLLEATRQQLAQSAPDEIAAAFGRAVEREVGITRNAAAIAATKRRILGDAPPAP